MKHLTRGQRYEIQMYSLLGMNKSEIARILHVHKSTITREFQRNSDVRNKGTYYFASRAERKQKKRYASRRVPRKFTDEMKEKARYYLEELQMSPEQIVGYCKKHGIKMVSHETLYQWIWEDKKAGGSLHTHLRHRGRRHHKRGLSRKRRGIIPNRVDISERPKIVDRRTRFGDFEIDTIVGANHRQHILTINERVTGRLWMRRLAVPTAAVAASMAINILQPMADAGLTKTITADNGLQFARHETVTEELGIKFYFAKPYHSWERGSNENLNGLIRQYIPKGTDFDTLTREDLLAIQEKINNRPRKRLAFSSPNDIFVKLTRLDPKSCV